METLYSASPMFLALNASYMKPLLYPLFDSQSSESFALPYSAEDLGKTVRQGSKRAPSGYLLIWRG